MNNLKHLAAVKTKTIVPSLAKPFDSVLYHVLLHSF